MSTVTSTWRDRLRRWRSYGPSANIRYFGHHKCASTWMRAFLREVSDLIGFNYVVDGGNSAQNRVLPSGRFTIFLNVNSTPESLDELELEARAFHLIRDPRDALVSDYFSRRNSHKVDNRWKQQLRDTLQQYSLEEGMWHMLDHCSYLRQIEGWHIGQLPRVLDVRYEALVEDAFGQFLRILNHLGVHLPASVLREIVEKCSFRKLSGGRERGEEDKGSHFRKGAPGDWLNYLPPGSRLHQEFMRRYGHLLNQLGYE